ncbi:hypothetical protein R3P38DRAFT_2615603 [Favolaschia claudopus]|uniref:Taste receptor type 2 n=1 Tax=Favolaschia claudopus TaxID=2862362 RepID=A0AAW0CK76_9AGAR
MAHLTRDKAELFSTVFEGICYGFSLLMFVITLWVLLRDCSPKQINKPIVVIACLLFILSTIHLAIDIDRLNLGFFVYRDTYPGGSIEWFANPALPLWIVKISVYSLQTALGDGVVIYRCYQVWRSIWIAAFLSLLWIFVAVTAAGSIYTASRAPADPTNHFAGILPDWITTFIVSTWTCNLTATLLLAFKLWRVTRATRHHRIGPPNPLSSLLILVIDAGALYSTALMIVLIFYVLHLDAAFLVLNAMVPIISISFHMIFLRIGLQSRLGSVDKQQGTVRTENDTRYSIAVTVTTESISDRPLSGSTLQGGL